MKLQKQINDYIYRGFLIGKYMSGKTVKWGVYSLDNTVEYAYGLSRRWVAIDWIDQHSPHANQHELTWQTAMGMRGYAGSAAENESRNG